MSLIITRPFYCPEHNNHVFAKYYVAYGSTRQLLFPYEINMRIIHDITPHIISVGEMTDTEVPIVVSCGIIGCGISLKNFPNISEGIIIHSAREYTLSRKDFDALFHFKKTGYELSKHKR